MSDKIDKHNECYTCIHRQNVPGNSHIRCSKPDKEMKGDTYGKQMGWFIYPFLFDPVWKLKNCNNYEKKI